jgi:hypothetical protein
VGEIDRMTATLVAQSPLPEVEQGDGWAFAFWGGAFYTFTAPNGTSQVTRFNPANGKVEKVADFTGGGVIVGAGVSTCAPAQ